MPTFRTLALLPLALAGACADRAPSASPVTTPRIVNANAEPGNWLSHGRTYDEQRFSPLTTISAANVGTLGLAWSYEFTTPRGAEATPLVIDGVMYVTSAWSIVHALDAATGKALWTYDPKVNHARGARACCDVVNRGVAAYEGRIYVGTIDGRLVALDEKSGTVAWEKMTVDSGQAYTITGAPRAVNGLVYIGNGGAEYGVRGYLSAYDANTGDLKWRFYTVPGDPAKGPDGAASDSIMAEAAKTWTGEWWKLGGGGTVWDAIVYDKDLDQLIVGVGNGSPWNRQIRSPQGGDNLFLSSIIALDAKTGRYKWHYQTTPGETWDYTATQPIILAELTIDGAARKVAMQAPKNGFFYVVDRTNGKLISAKPFIPMARTKDTPKGFPISWAYGVDSVTGRPLENPEARYVGAAAVVMPSGFGAHNWQPMSYSPQTGLVYLPSQLLAGAYVPKAGFAAREGMWNTGTDFQALPDDPKIRGIVRATSTGTLLAWDPVKNREVWRVAQKGPWNGGTMATAGGLVFEGTVDGRFIAYDDKTGKELWSYNTQAATLSGPVTYTVGNDQYVAVLGGYGTAFFTIAGVLAPTSGVQVNGHVYVFKLGGKAPQPRLALTPVPMPKPPAFTWTDAQYATGTTLFANNCMVCHGFGAIGGGSVPDLRYSPKLQAAEPWAGVVLKGEKTAGGMPSFGALLKPDEAELVRAYVVKQAMMASAP
ncbi:MAG: PQQ-dependent dehydrogenase, methanol/ethanol family [Gemmatimonadetes bacterium]|nr:PQQ-dependent dehydrogenase, methanol/ethanol family [Gemmatimonadota bacterium]